MTDVPALAPALAVTVTIPSDVTFLPMVSRIALDAIRQALGDRASEELLSRADICLTEAVTNAITHAHGSDATRPTRFGLEVTAGSIRMTVEDRGPGFELDRVPAPDFENLTEHGRGIYIIRHSVSRLVYEPGRDGGHILVMELTPGEIEPAART